MSNEDLDLVDKYIAGTLNQEEHALLNERMRIDLSFREQLETQQAFLKSLKEYDERKSVKQLLNTFHKELGTVTDVKKESVRVYKLWPTIGIAASVALVCAIGTLFMARWFDQEHKANYQELRRNVERLKKSQTQILENIKKDKIRNTPSKYSGSGFMISSSGYVVTSYHVIKAADSVYIENEKFGKLKTLVVYSNPSYDLALLMTSAEFKSNRSNAFSIRSREGDIGEPVYTLGFPREEIVYGDGSISASTGYDQDQNAYQVSVPVNPGNSGGPLLDQQGALLGIINGFQTKTQGTAFAIKSSLLLETLQSIPSDSLPRPLKLTTQNQLLGMTRVDQIKRLKDYVFLVKVYNGK